MLACICPPAASLSDGIVFVEGYPSYSLWRRNIAPMQKPQPLYGHNVADSYLVPSPDGQWVTAALIPEGARIGLFDTSHTGRRRTIQLLPLGQETFLKEWAPNGDGLLVSKSINDPGGTHLGVYLTKLDGRRKLIAASPAKDLGGANYARYSPAGDVLAVEGDNWLQLVRFPGAKTFFFRNRNRIRRGRAGVA